MNTKQVLVIIGFVLFLGIAEIMIAIGKVHRDILINISIWPMLIGAFLLFYLRDKK